MNKTYVKISLLVMAVALVASLPAAADAQTRRENLEVNRDYRNTKLRASSTPSGAQALLRVASSTRARADMFEFRAAWMRAPGSPFRTASSTLMIRLASSSDLRGHEKWNDAPLEKFAFLQNKLIAETERSLNRLLELRAKIADRIDRAEDSGRDMTDAKALLVTADSRLDAAESAIEALASYAPPAIASSTDTVGTSTKIRLERPREIGKTAIEAVKEAKDSLQDVIRAIAQNMGLKTGQNATTTP